MAKWQKIGLFWFLAVWYNTQRHLWPDFFLCNVCSTRTLKMHRTLMDFAEIFGFTQQSMEVRCFAKCSVLFVFSLVTCQEERVILSASKAPNGHCKWSLSFKKCVFGTWNFVIRNWPHHAPLVVLASSLELCPGSGTRHKNLVSVCFIHKSS